VVPETSNTTSTSADPEPHTAEFPPRAASSFPARSTEVADVVEDLVRDLIDEVSEVHAFDESLGDVLLDLEVDGVRCVLIAAKPETDHHVALSPREQEIARMVAQGYPNKTIAAVLEISSWTVSTHLRRVFAKLGVRSRAAMVARLVGDHLLSEADLRSRGAP
jgi:DNA-binding CsgD family transcriptional regulator